MIRLLIAPDSFKGSCPAQGVAQALARGAARAAREAGRAVAIRQRPLSDGGEGLIEAIAASLGGERRRARVRAVDIGGDPPWRQAEWLWVPGRRAAFGEVAGVVGFEGSRATTPLERTALGIGDYLSAMRQAGARRIVLGIGGTATVDGGASVVQALGGRFWGDEGVIRVATLLDAARATDLEPAPRWPQVDVVCWADVVTPLVGPEGAVPLFAPQKGATTEQVARLAEAAAVWGEMARRATGADPTAPGTGAGGGIPFGLAVALGAGIDRGAANVIALLELSRDAAWADLVWTGEGRVDPTTLQGKLVQQVVGLARDAGAEAAVLAGQVAGVGQDALGGAELHALSDGGATLRRCLESPEPALEALAQRVLGQWLARNTRSDSSVLEA